jgi:hypothetical protein
MSRAVGSLDQGGFFAGADYSPRDNGSTLGRNPSRNRGNNHLRADADGNVIEHRLRELLLHLARY